MQENLYREKNGQLSFIQVPDSKYKDTYSYHGPVYLFSTKDRPVAHVKLKTQAVSFDKAYSNMTYQVKKELGYQVTTKIVLNKNLIKKEETKYGKSI